jgi:hypothetical protein
VDPTSGLTTEDIELKNDSKGKHHHWSNKHTTAAAQDMVTTKSVAGVMPPGSVASAGTGGLPAYVKDEILHYECADGKIGFICPPSQHLLVAQLPMW